MAADPSAFDEADLNAFTDGRLEPTRAAALADSLASDRHARARIDGWKRQNDGLRTLFASVLFEPVPVRLLPTTLAGAGTGAKPSVTPLPRPSVERGWSASSVMAMTTVGVALVGFMAGALATIATDGFGHAGWTSRGAESHAATDQRTLPARAAESFRAILADPLFPNGFSAADEVRLQHWMTRQISGTARIPDLHEHGWVLLGGQVVPGRFGLAAILVYGKNGGRAALYLAREPIPAASATTTAEDGMSVTAWSEDGLGAAVALEQAGSRLDGTAETLRDAVRRQVRDDVVSP